MGRWVLLPTISVLGWMIYLLPDRLRVRVGNAFGYLLRLARFRAGVIVSNLAIAFPEATDAACAERVRLEAEAYRHLGNLVLEVVLVLGPFRCFSERVQRLEGYENWKEARDRGRGVIFLSSHVGNWELMAASGALAGMELLLVTKHLKPEWFHRAFEAGRLKAGVRGTYEPRTFRDVLSHLKAGKTVGIVLDQYTGPPVGIRVPFFGVPVGTHSVLAVLAKRTGAAVVPVVNFRRPDGKISVQIGRPLEWVADDHGDRELALNTARYASVIEAFVRAHPEQWLWTHKRFKGDLGPLRPGEWEQGRVRRGDSR